jgi:hypothetical protein
MLYCISRVSFACELEFKALVLLFHGMEIIIHMGKQISPLVVATCLSIF